MNATNAYPAESPLVQATLSWPEFLIMGLAALIVSALALLAPYFGRRGRTMIVTDLLKK